MKHNSQGQPHDEVWCNHMFSKEEYFSNLQEPKKRGLLETGDNTQHEIKELGDVKLDGNHKAKSLCEVLHVPTITKNLIYVGQMVERGYQVKFNHQRMLY